MGSRLYVDTKKENTRFKRVSKGYFGLAERSHSDEITQRVETINNRTRKKLSQLLHDMPADRFEALIGELLLAIGFDEDTVEVTKYHGDGGQLLSSNRPTRRTNEKPLFRPESDARNL